MNKDRKLLGLTQKFSPSERSINAGFRLSLLLVAGVAILLTGRSSFARPHNEGTKTLPTPENISVENFGKVTDFYYRGAQPEREEYFGLASIGVKTIIDLRDDPKSFAMEMTERAGMKYINMPMSDTKYPSEETAANFLRVVNGKENWPVFVHCAGGRHRTGAMTAVFRMTMQGWDVERAYVEMKDYDFYTRWGHKAMKRFVYDFYRGLQQRREIIQIDSTSR